MNITKINVNVRLWSLEHRYFCVINTNEILEIVLLKTFEVPIELRKIIETFYGKMGFLDHVVVPYLKEALLGNNIRLSRLSLKPISTPQKFKLEISFNKKNWEKLYQFSILDSNTYKKGYLKSQLESNLLNL